MVYISTSSQPLLLTSSCLPTSALLLLLGFSFLDLPSSLSSVRVVSWSSSSSLSSCSNCNGDECVVTWSLLIFTHFVPNAVEYVGPFPLVGCPNKFNLVKSQPRAEAVDMLHTSEWANSARDTRTVPAGGSVAKGSRDVFPNLELPAAHDPPRVSSRST